jgi:hypothetical protein
LTSSEHILKSSWKDVKTYFVPGREGCTKIGVYIKKFLWGNGVVATLAITTTPVSSNGLKNIKETDYVV